jgi:hypothetical protein
MKYPKIIILLGLLLFIITACQTREQELSFETIAQGDGFYTGQGYGGEKPNLLVTASLDEINKPGLDVQFPSEVADQLRQLDYDRFFTILVLHGRVGSTRVSVTVQQITRQDEKVTIRAEFVKPSPGTRSEPAFTSPYHLVAVSKRGEWGQQIHFVLVVDSEEVAETSHFIP